MPFPGWNCTPDADIRLYALWQDEMSGWLPPMTSQDAAACIARVSPA